MPYSSLNAPSRYKSMEERWKWILAFMVVEDMFVHEMLLMMEKIETRSVPMMGIMVEGTRIKLAYNPIFVNNVDDPTLRWALTHEIYHVALHHCTVRRPEDPKEKGIWNKAADLAINSLIQQTSDRRWNLDEVKLCWPKDMGFEEKLSLEQYLQLLREKDDDGKGGNGGVYGSCGGGGDGDDEGDKEMGGGFDSHDDWKDSEVVREIIRNKIEELSKRERVWGNMPGDVKARILAAQKSQVKWTKYLRQHLGNMITCRSESTFKRPNRRFGYPYCGTKRKHSDRKLVLIDTSGSVGEEELAQFLVEVNKLCEIQPVDLQLFDHQLQGPCRPFERRHVSYEFKGRGGTSFAEGFKLAEERRYQSVIMLTDGAADPIPKPRFVRDILWVITGEGKPPVEWGKIVKIVPKQHA